MDSRNTAESLAAIMKKPRVAGHRLSMPLNEFRAGESGPLAGGLLTGFAPVAAPGATCLILGSMPSVASLNAGEYYAHPRNIFWRLMLELTGAPPDLPYARRLAVLSARGIALWDVIHRCRRVGSLDQKIDADTIEINDFITFFKEHQKVRRVFFNGNQAEILWQRHVSPALAGQVCLPPGRRLPSTSPANAVLSYAQKLAAWRVIFEKECL